MISELRDLSGEFAMPETGLGALFVAKPIPDGSRLRLHYDKTQTNSLDHISATEVLQVLARTGVAT